MRFVAKRYIIQQKCLKGQIGTVYLYTDPESLTAQRYMDGHTDRQTT